MSYTTTSFNSLYDSPFGPSEIPVSTRQNALGQTVVDSGAWYNGKGQQMQMKQVIPGIYTTSTSSTVGSAATNQPKVTNTASFADALGGLSETLPTNSTGYGYGGGAVGSAASSYQDAINALLGGVDSAKAAASRTAKIINTSGGDYDEARRAARSMSNYASRITNSADSLAPYAASIRGNGDALSDVAAALISGDPSVGGTVGDYLSSVRTAVNSLNTLDPNIYAARARADVQSQYDSAAGQLQRDMSRRGVSLGSGAAATLQQQLTRALATASAAAMTRGWQTGVADRATADIKKAELFKDVIAQSNEARQQSTSDYATAAGIVQKQGDMFSSADDVVGKQVDAFINIGNAEVNLGEIDLKNESLVQNTIQNAASAYQAMAKFYQDTMSETTTSSGRSAEGNYVHSTTTKSYS